MASTQAKSILHDLNPFQLCLIMKSAIPRPDLLHKMVDYITYLNMDGKSFMKLSDKKLADLVCYDSLTITRVQDLRKAQPQEVQLLLEARWRRQPEPITTTEAETPDLHDEVPTVPVSDPLPAPINPASLNLPPDTATIIEAAPIFTGVDTNTHTSTEDGDQNGSSLDLESSTHPGADETPLNLEPAIAAEASPIDPHSVPLPQLDDSELDLPIVEEDGIYEESSSTAVPSELESDLDGLSSDDDTRDDESQAWSLVGDEEMEEVHVSAENEVEVNEAEGMSSSPLDITHDAHIELPSVTPENVDASTGAQSLLPVAGIDQIISAHVNSTTPDVSAPLISEVGTSHHGHEAGLTPPLAVDDNSQQDHSPTIDDLATYVNVSEPESSSDVQDVKESHDSTTLIGSVDADQSSSTPDSPDPPQAIPIAGSSTPPTESNVSEPESSGDVQEPHDSTTLIGSVDADQSSSPDSPDPPQAIPVIAGSSTPLTESNVSEPESSGDVKDVKEPHDSTTLIGGVDADQSSPDSGPDPPQTIPVIAKPSTPPTESNVSEPEDDANTASTTDNTPPADLPNTEEDTPEVTETVSTEEPAETVVNDSQEEQPNLNPVANEPSTMNPEETHSESTRTEQPLLPLSDPSEVFGDLRTNDSAISIQPVAEELDPITFEDSASAPAISSQNDDILVVHVVHSPIEVSVDLDVSASASPSSSTRSVFSDAPYPNGPFTDFHLVSPVSPVFHLDKQSILFFCEGVCDDYNFLTSPIDITQLLPFSSGFDQIDPPVHDYAPGGNELQLVDHPLPIDGDTVLEDSMSSFSLDDFSYDPDESSLNGDNLIDFLDEHVPIEDRSEVSSMSVYASMESSLLDEDTSDRVVALPGTSTTNDEEQLTGVPDNNQEETSILSKETVQQTSDEAASSIGYSDPVVPLPAASTMNEGQLTDAPTLSDEIVQEESSVTPNGPLVDTGDCPTLHAVEEPISAPLEPSLLEEDRAEASIPALAVRGDDPVVTLPAASGTNDEEHLTGISGDNQEETPILSNESVQQAPNESTITMGDSDSVIPLPQTFCLNEGQLTDEIPSLSNETVQQASNEVDPEELSSEAESSTSAPLGPPLLDEDKVEASDPPPAMDNDTFVPLPAASSTNEGQLTEDNQVESPVQSNEAVQQAPSEAPDETLTDCTTHASKFKGLPPINTNITSLMDDLSAYLSPEDYKNPIVRTSCPTSRPRSRLLSPGSPPRSLFPMCETSNFTSDRTVASYSSRLQESFGRSTPRSSLCDIAIQTDLGSQDLQPRTQEENSTTSSVAPTLVSPLSSVSTSFRQFFSFGDRPRPDED